MVYPMRVKLYGSGVAVVAFLCLGVATRAWQVPVDGRTTKRSEPHSQIAFVGILQVASRNSAQPFPQGSSLVKMEKLEAPQGKSIQTSTNLTPQLFAVAYPHVSFDGASVLFSGQKEKGSGWQIWEMAADGSNLRQITHCSGDCLQADYLPLNQIVYVAISGNGPLQSSTLYISQLNGGKAHPITFGPGNFYVEKVLHSGRILVSAESPLRTNLNGKSHRALYVIRPDGTGLHLLPPGSTMASSVLDGANGSQESLAPHVAPLSYPSILHLELKTGRAICLDSYLSMDAPQGRIATPIVQVRVMELKPDHQERILGNAPVEKDGSFYITVPADMPIRFALLDAHGAVIREQKSWVWIRPGEDRGCLGCHENHALAPENHWPLTLQRFDTPTPVGVDTHPTAAKKDP